MTVEQRLQYAIGFLLGNQSASDVDLVAYLVSQGDIEATAHVAIIEYQQMLFGFGYITVSNFDALKGWVIGTPQVSLNNAASLLLKKYYETLSNAKLKADLEARNLAIDSDIAMLSAALSQAEIDELVNREIASRAERVGTLSLEKSDNLKRIAELSA